MARRNASGVGYAAREYSGCQKMRCQLGAGIVSFVR
jgi:hypothetical protein